MNEPSRRRNQASGEGETESKLTILLNVEFLLETGDVSVVDVGAVEVLEEEGEGTADRGGEQATNQHRPGSGDGGGKEREGHAQADDGDVQLPDQRFLLGTHSSRIPVKHVPVGRRGDRGEEGNQISIEQAGRVDLKLTFQAQKRAVLT
jgi:hypothetical protein